MSRWLNVGCSLFENDVHVGAMNRANDAARVARAMGQLPELGCSCARAGTCKWCQAEALAAAEQKVLWAMMAIEPYRLTQWLASNDPQLLALGQAELEVRTLRQK